MARTRATQARDAFARVGTAQVGTVAGDDASDSASEKASVFDDTNAGLSDSSSAGNQDSQNASPAASYPASAMASRTASTTASRTADGRAGKKAGTKRRMGRPRGPARVALTIRILAANDERLTAAVEATGQSPQYVVDAALAAYFDALGIPAGSG
jgi:hypothetical protein